MRLNFSCSFEKAEEAVMPWGTPVTARLLTAVMFAGVIGGLLLSNQLDLRVEPLQVQASRTTPASPEMMQLLRDEHDLVADMVKAQLAGVKAQLAGSGSSFDSQPIAATKRRQVIAMR
jgi:hypothetical protein